MPEIQFDATSHTYTVEGIVRPSVTQIIRAAGLMDGEEFFTEEARLRGDRVHRACHYLDEKDLEESWLETSPLSGYVRAWQRFKAEARVTVELVEHRVFHPQHGYCGTLDRTCKFAGLAAGLVDIKTSASVQAWWALQSAAYAATFDHPRRLRRMSVQLFSDGSYRVTEYAPGDWPEHIGVFRAALGTWDFREKNRRNLGGNSDGAYSSAA